MIQQSLFMNEAPVRSDWRPQELPSLANVDRLAGDTESSGLRWYGNDFMTGFSFCLPDGSTFYVPIRHAGGNIDEDKAKEWCRRELVGKQIDFFYAAYDLNVFHRWGIDLEAQGCTFSDPGHWAALLDDHRRHSSLEAIAQEYLGHGKLPCPQIDHMAEVHAADVEEYARQDVSLLHDLRKKLWPMLDAQDLQRVRQLEDDCIPATAEMMRNGAPINEELLDQWLARSEREYVASLWDLHNDLGKLVNPKSHPDMLWIFKRLGLEPPTNDMPPRDRNPDWGKVTFSKRYLDKVDHPVMKKVRHTLRLASLRSKYLVPYKEELKKYGRLLYSLNQLRSGGDDEDYTDVGTISGRYSSSSFGKTGDGANIQQVAGKKFDHSTKEEDEWPYHIRLLFTPEKGLWCSADADQIEYRIFAHYAQPKRVMEAYAKDVHTNFHKITQELIEQHIAITYERTKDCNFAGLYLAGDEKFSWMIDIPYLEGRKLYAAYHEGVPEVQAFGKKCMQVARSRGYVKTVLGRRARFPDQQRLHAAINRVVQGSAADEMKTKIVALRKARTGMRLRFVVHDEFDGDVPNRECAEEVSRVLNEQILPMRVPLLWTVKTGPNWQECKK